MDTLFDGTITGPAPARTAANAPDGEPAFAGRGIALIECCGLTIGIDVAHVREVIPAPQSLQPMPSSVSGVAGCVALRGLLVPVLDFPSMLGRHEVEPGEIIVVVTLDRHVFGIEAQATRRIVSADQLRAQDHAPGAMGLPERIFPSLFLMEETLVALLDPAALVDLGVPRTRDTLPPARSSDISEQYLLFEIESHTFVLPVAQVDGTVPETEVGGDTMVSGSCEGAIRRHDMEMALINPLVMAGMRPPGPRPKTSSAILVTIEEERRVAIRADRVKDIIHIKESMIRPLPRVVARRSDLFLGIVTPAEGVWHHVLDPEAMRRDDGLRAFSRLARRLASDRPAQQARSQRGRRGTALLFQAGGDFALPIDAVAEIVPLPEAATAGQLSGAHLCNMTHRNGLLPIFSLSAVLAGEGSTFGSSSAVVVTDCGGERVGLAVADLLSIEQVAFVDHYDGTPEGLAERQRDGKTRLFKVLSPDQIAMELGYD